MSLALAIEWKLKKLGQWENQVSIRTENNILTHWNVTGVNQPDQSTLNFWVNEYQLIGANESSFNIDVMTARMGEEFTGIDAINLSPYLEAFRSFGRARNFSGMKGFRDGLVAASKATADQANIITEIVNEQGIDLNSY